MIKIKLSDENISRIKAFLNSENYKTSFSKSEMWKEFGSSSKVTFEGSNVVIHGDSGLYLSKLNPLRKFLFKLKNLIINFNRLPLYLSYQKAFDLVMQNKQIRGKKQFDFNIAPHHKIFKNFNEIKKDPCFKDFDFEYYETKHYYLFNILRTYINFDNVTNVMEIGGGSGHFSTLINHHHSNIKTYIDIDIPETIIFNICFIMNFFPDKKICLPNEVNKENIYKNDFVFLTPNQINLIKDNSIDLSINTASFAEMTKKDISIYFDLIQRTSKKNGYFLNHNRVHKNPEGKNDQANKNLEPNFFAEYPYKNNKVVIYDICRLVQLLEKDPFMIRLEQIDK